MADIICAPSAAFESTFAAGMTALEGTVAVGIYDGQGDVTLALDSDDIVETPAGSGIYVASRNAPANSGQYVLVWSLDGTTDPDQVFVDQLLVTASAPSPLPPPIGPYLCSVEDVLLLVPGYGEDEETDDMLEQLVAAESRAAHTRYGREFISATQSSELRTFDIDAETSRRGRLAVGDMTLVTSVVVKTLAGETVWTVSSTERVLLGQNGLRNRLSWEPTTTIWFPGRTLPEGCVVDVSGVWGFPQIPDDLRIACAKLVLVRYLADAASSGTALADALNQQGFDAGIAFASAREVLRSYQDTKF